MRYRIYGAFTIYAARSVTKPPEALAEHIFQALHSLEEPPRDDLTLVVCQRRPDFPAS